MQRPSPNISSNIMNRMSIFESESRQVCRVNNSFAYIFTHSLIYSSLYSSHSYRQTKEVHTSQSQWNRGHLFLFWFSTDLAFGDGVKWLSTATEHG